jgi:hypothetical protein
MGARTRIVRATGPRGVVRAKTKVQVGEIVDMVAKRRGETHAFRESSSLRLFFLLGLGVLCHLNLGQPSFHFAQGGRNVGYSSLQVPVGQV